MESVLLPLVVPRSMSHKFVMLQVRTAATMVQNVDGKYELLSTYLNRIYDDQETVCWHQRVFRKGHAQISFRGFALPNPNFDPNFAILWPKTVDMSKNRHTKGNKLPQFS